MGIPSCVAHEGHEHIGRRASLILRYIEPFSILWIIGEVDYELVLPSHFHLSTKFFHVFIMQNYIPHESNVLQCDAVDFDNCLTFVEELVKL